MGIILAKEWNRMTRVVFTGPAVDGSGNTVVRAALAAACAQKSIEVQASVRPNTDILVASRLDTLKAKRAASTGMKVIGYPEFINQYLCGVCVPVSGRANLHTTFANSLAQDLLVPDFTTNQQGELKVT